jgi:hypothetical protein
VPGARFALCQWLDPEDHLGKWNGLGR